MIAAQRYRSGPPVDVHGIDLEELISKVLQLADEETNWKLLTQYHEDMAAYEFNGAYKFKVSIPRPLEETYQFFCDIEKRPQWDEMTVEARILNQIDASNRLHYTRAKGFFAFPSRDLVTLYHRRCLPDGRLMSLATSVSDVFYPLMTGVVRAHAYFIGNIFAVHPNNPNHCIITQISLIDIKANVPNFLLKLVASHTFPSTMKKLRKAIEKHCPEKESTETLE